MQDENTVTSEVVAAVEAPAAVVAAPEVPATPVEATAESALPTIANGKNVILPQHAIGKLKEEQRQRGRREAVTELEAKFKAAGFGSIEDAIARGQAYEQAGVDALFFVGVRTRVELDAISAGTRLPLILRGGTPELSDRDYLASRRVRIALQGHQPIAAAVKAVHDTLKALREGTPPSKLTGIADAELMKRVTRDHDYTKWTKDFLS